MGIEEMEMALKNIQISYIPKIPWIYDTVYVHCSIPNPNFKMVCSRRIISKQCTL